MKGIRIKFSMLSQFGGNWFEEDYIVTPKNWMEALEEYIREYQDKARQLEEKWKREGFNDTMLSLGVSLESPNTTLNMRLFGKIYSYVLNLEI